MPIRVSVSLIFDEGQGGLLGDGQTVGVNISGAHAAGNVEGQDDGCTAERDFYFGGGSGYGRLSDLSIPTEKAQRADAAASATVWAAPHE